MIFRCYLRFFILCKNNWLHVVFARTRCVQVCVIRCELVLRVQQGGAPSCITSKSSSQKEREKVVPQTSWFEFQQAKLLKGKVYFQHFDRREHNPQPRNKGCWYPKIEARGKQVVVRAQTACLLDKAKRKNNQTRKNEYKQSLVCPSLAFFTG